MNKIFTLSLLFLLSFTTVQGKKDFPKRELRAVWIATVKNIDWPSKTGLTVKKQKKEFIKQLDLHKKNGMNAIVFQIRPAADAFYKSKYEPWSQWLSGTQGQAPEPFYDPLKFAVDECHKRGMELHAWLNPYRAVVDYEKTETSSEHITNRHPEWFLEYGKNKYFNPGFPETRNYVAKIVGEVVRRYDIDAIHFDDYFYPYKIYKKPFPDSLCFVQYNRGFVKDSIDDWRRDNVNLIIKQLRDTIKQIKPYVKFGISPFGVWRNQADDPKGSNTEAGQTNYDDLYADILLWLKKGWIDYVTPQIYWHIGKKVADYEIIEKWWDKNNFGRNTYVGHGVYRLNRKSKVEAWRSPKELFRQIEMNRQSNNIKGSFYFSSKSFLKNPLGLNKKLRKNYYRYPALVPENNMIATIYPNVPKNLKLEKKPNNILSWNKSENARFYAVYKFTKNENVNLNSANNICTVSYKNKIALTKKDIKTCKFVVTAISRTNTESAPSEVVSLD